MKQCYFSKLIILAAISLAMNYRALAQTTIFTYVAAIQTYTVPAGVTSISITASGAQGGNTLTPAGNGGLGASMSGIFAVVPGQILNVIVGQQPATATYNAGGGGGSFVWDASATATPLIVVGGGGGAGASASGAGINASLDTNGTNGGGGTIYGGAGTAGHGGRILTSSGIISLSYGAGGCGWLSNGAGGSSGLVAIAPLAGGGQTPLSGGAGGVAGGPAGYAGIGGFGGGGGGESPSSASASSGGGGGGGGYSGGGGGGGTPLKGGGGGGSYCSGTLTDTSVSHMGDGIVTITIVCGPGPITGNSALCIGYTETLSSSPFGGTWLSLNPSVATINSGGMVTGVAAGVDTIFYIVSSGCGTVDTAMATVLVNASSAAGAITGVLTVCVGATTTLSDSLTGGSWNASNGNATVSGGMVNGIAPGMDTITYTNTCGMASTSVALTINPLPSAGTISGASLSVCVGGTITLSDATPGGAWSASNTNATVSGGIVTGVTAGMDSIKYSVTNSCGTAFAGAVATVDPLPSAGAIMGPVSICVGASVLLTDATAGGTWNATNANASVAGGNVTGVSAGSDTIEYIITTTCGTAMATYTITVNSTPSAGAISGPPTVCAAAMITLTDPVAGGTWSSDNGNAMVMGGVVTGVTPGADTILYSISDICGTVMASFVISIDPVPSAGTISGADSVCIGSSITLADPVTGGVWGSDNTNATVTAAGVVAGVTAGADTITYMVSLAGCAARAVMPLSIISCRTSVENISAGNAALNIYPNPAMDELNIENAGIGTTIKLFSIAGKQVYSGVISNNTQTINIQNMVPGAYMLQLTDSAGSRTTRMVMKQ